MVETATNTAKAEKKSGGPSDKAFTVPHTAASIAASLTGNVFQPWLPIVWVSVVIFGGVLGFAFWRQRAGKPIVGLLGFAIMGLLISVFLLASQFAPKSAEGRQLTKEVGVVAATVPGLVAVQNAVLPISEREKEMNAFRLAITRGEEEDRGLAARTALDASAEGPVRNALQGIALRSDAASVRQAGLAQALADRKGSWFAISLDSESDAPIVLPVMRGAQFQLSAVAVDTGAVAGAFQCGEDGSRRPIEGVVASGRLTLTVSCYSRAGAGAGWRVVQLDLAPDAKLRLVGAAKIGAEGAAVSAPLL